MSTLTTAERERLPLDDFVIPEHRVMPVIDSADVEQARRLLLLPSLRHRAAEGRQRLAAIAWRKGLPLPAGDPAAFAAPKYTQAQLDQLLPADFADMANRKWPVLDQQDLDNCIRNCPQAREASHPIRSQLIKLAARRQLKLPADWDTAVHSADFARATAHAANQINTAAQREASDAQAGAKAVEFALARNAHKRAALLPPGPVPPPPRQPQRPESPRGDTADFGDAELAEVRRKAVAFAQAANRRGRRPGTP
jgi:hypothetical protein